MKTNANKIIDVAGDYATVSTTIDHTTRLNDIFANSLDLCCFIVSVEKECRCELKDEQVRKFATIADVISCVNEIKSAVDVDEVCPVCNTPIGDFTPSEGCWICPNCGHSPCAL